MHISNYEKHEKDWLIDWWYSVLRCVGDTSANNGGKGKDLYLAALNMLSPFSWEISIKNSEEIKIHVFNFGILLTFLLAAAHVCLTRVLPLILITLNNPCNWVIFIKHFADHKQEIDSSCQFNIAHRVSRLVSKFLIS